MNYPNRTIRLKITQGAAAQVLLVLIAAVFSPYAQIHRLTFGYFAGILMTVNAARLGFARFPIFRHQPAFQKILNYFFPLASGLSWGILAALSIYSHLSFGDDMILPMITVGNAAASCTSLFYDLRLNRLYILFMFIPQFVAFCFAAGGLTGNLGYFLAVLIFIAYISREAAFANRLFTTNVLLRDEALQRQIEVETSRAMALSSARRAAVGEIAGGLAHELNNPLTIIRGTAALLGEQRNKNQLTDDVFDSSLERIHKTVDRMTKIIRSLLSFAQQTQQDEIVARPLAHIIDEVLDVTQDRLKRRGIDLRVRIEPARHHRVRDRGTQISQVMVNLLNNADDAIVSRPDPWISIQAESKDSKIWISVEDCGDGIPSAHRDLIFQPFFTTKSLQEGTGLGLSLSRNLIEDLGGELICDHGCANTRFVIKIPVSK